MRWRAAARSGKERRVMVETMERGICGRLRRAGVVVMRRAAVRGGEVWLGANPGVAWVGVVARVGDGPLPELPEFRAPVLAPRRVWQRMRAR